MDESGGGEEEGVRFEGEASQSLALAAKVAVPERPIGEPSFPPFSFRRLPPIDRLLGFPVSNARAENRRISSLADDTEARDTSSGVR